MEKLGFVIPWFGNSMGGAEILCKGLVQRLKSAGFDVEVLTTCGKNAFSEWDIDFYPEGISEIDGIPTRRFKLDGRNVSIYHNLNYKLATNEKLTDDEAYQFLQNTINSRQMYGFIKENANKYLFVFMPYLYGTTFYGSIIAPERSYHIPCLHNEPNAYFSFYTHMFSNSRGIFFLSKAEMNFARTIYDLNPNKCFLLGGGVDRIEVVNPDAFRKKFNIDGDFVIYVGRKVEGKGATLLTKYFTKFVKENHLTLRLILIGGGVLNIPKNDDAFIIDLGELSEEDKYNAISAALFLIQPSFFESFSIVLMEAWLLKKAVIVNESCAVTKEHCIESNGGLYFSNYPEFVECMNLLIEKKEFRKRLGENGYNYVVKNFMWEDVTKRFIEFFNATKQ